MMEEITIYKLLDPVTTSIRYIGWTHKPLKKRLTDHLSDARRGLKNYRCNWIRSLLSQGLSPTIDVIEKVGYNKRNEREKYWISYYGRKNLVNGTDGGEGVCGLLVSEETRLKQSLARTGKSPWNKGVPILNVHLKKFQFKKGNIPFNKGVPCSQKIAIKISESKRGRAIGKNLRTNNVCFGVTYNRLKNIWISQITFMRKTYFIGRYKLEENAGIAYDICSIWFSKDNRKLNFPKKGEEYMILLSSNEIKSLKELRKIIRKYIEIGGNNNGNS